MRMRDIVLRQVFPPIPAPDRPFDWAAWHDGDEEENHQGYGATPEEALADLARLDQERAEALEDAEGTS
jgi:hypothetical protein